MQKVRFSEEFAVFLQKVIPEITQDEIDFYEYAIEVLWELKDLQSAPDVAYSVIMQYAIKALQFAKSLPNEAPFEE